MIHNSTSCSLAHLMQNIVYLHDPACRVSSKDITNNCIAVELYCILCYTVTHILQFYGHKIPQNLFKLTAALRSLTYICGQKTYIIQCFCSWRRQLPRGWSI